MTTPLIMSVTDELIAELEAAANAATPQNLDSAEGIIKADPCVMIECPICHGEGYASHENDYCNFDNHAIGVQFYGIGTEFGAGERYFRAANPSTILALLSERAELKAENEALREDHDKAWRLAGMNLENLGAALAENDRLRKQIDDMSPFKGAPLTGPDLKCLACGGYHYGMSGLPCPKMAPTAGAAMTP